MRSARQTLKREDSRTLVLVDDVGCISLTCNDALSTSTGGDTRRNLLRTRCGLEPPSNSSSIGTWARISALDVRGKSGRGHAVLHLVKMLRRRIGQERFVLDQDR